MNRTLYLANIAHCRADPGRSSTAFEAIENGALLVENGRILELGPRERLGSVAEARVVDFGDRLLIPGLIDCHVHFPQLDIIAAFGEQLLDWLERYAYPAEKRFADAAYARYVADLFTSELIANGTTTALVFTTVHPHSSDALFEAALDKDLRIIAGKVLMDRDAPDALLDTPESGYTDSCRLIERWHGRGRLGYAITPRYALTSSPEQLRRAGELAREYPDVWVHTHLAENREEVDLVAKAFPDRASYLDVYEHYGLLRSRSVFAHCIHLDDRDTELMAERGGAAAFCPSSNLFLGSGLFDLARLHRAGVGVGLATDVGAGTSLSMLRTMSDAYKVQQLKGRALSPAAALYLATLGAARALGVDEAVGSFAPGKDADFVVLDPRATRLSAYRTALTESLEEQLFCLMTLGDDRYVRATAVRGRLYDKQCDRRRDERADDGV